MDLTPHRFPFEWIDTCIPGSARVRLTATGPYGRQPNFPEILCLEILAQGASASLAATAKETRAEGDESGSSQGGLLAGIDEVIFSSSLRQHPLMAGDLLEVEVEQIASFGRLIKIHARMKREDQIVVEGDLMLAAG